MLIVVMLTVIMMSVIMLSVIMLNVVASLKALYGIVVRAIRKLDRDRGVYKRQNSKLQQ
jgi:hypothetical protein